MLNALAATLAPSSGGEGHVCPLASTCVDVGLVLWCAKQSAAKLLVGVQSRALDVWCLPSIYLACLVCICACCPPPGCPFLAAGGDGPSSAAAAAVGTPSSCWEAASGAGAAEAAAVKVVAQQGVCVRWQFLNMCN